MIDYVNVKKPTAFRFWWVKNRSTIKAGFFVFSIILIGCIGG